MCSSDLLWGKSPSENHSSTVASAITTSETTGTGALMAAHGVLIQILISAKKQSGSNKQSRLLFKISTSHCFEQYPHHQQYQQFTISTVPQKSKGTSYCSSQQKLLFTAIMTNHCSNRWKKHFTRVKARFFRDFRSIRCSFQPI